MSLIWILGKTKIEIRIVKCNSMLDNSGGRKKATKKDILCIKSDVPQRFFPL